VPGATLRGAAAAEAGDLSLLSERVPLGLRGALAQAVDDLPIVQGADERL